MNKANQSKYPHKKPAHLKKNPSAHQAWLNYKKARNQAQYRQKNFSATRCLVCQTTKFEPPLKNWVEEKHYQGSLNTVKEIFIGIDNPPNNAPEYGRQYVGSVFYCSLPCFNFQAEQEEREDWAKGKCSSCGIDLAVINDQCQELTHRKEMKYLPISPDCLKGGGK